MLFRSLRTQPFIDLGYFLRDLCKHLVYDVSHPWNGTGKARAIPGYKTVRTNDSMKMNVCLDHGPGLKLEHIFRLLQSDA